MPVSTQLKDCPICWGRLFALPPPAAPALSTWKSQDTSARLWTSQGELTEPFVPSFACVPPLRPAAESRYVDQAAHLLQTAERPILVAGGGVTSSGAREEVVELAESLGIPVATSLNAKGTIRENHRLSVGVAGTYSRDCANRAVAEADLVFFIGSRTGSQVTNFWRIPRPGTRVIQLDIAAEELGRHYPNAVSLWGDAKTVLRQILQATV